MKRMPLLWFCSIFLLLALTLVPAAIAGPLIEFGENGGYFQMDLKAQFYIENTDFGSGPNGTSRYEIPDMRQLRHFQDPSRLFLHRGE
jgi:hypothetical protein